MTYPISVILLSAGLSRRMGAMNKLLLQVDGVSMVRRSAELYRSMFSSVTVVTGFESDKIEKEFSGLDVTCVFNKDFETGQQSSVRCGVDVLPLNNKGVLIALADQSYLSKDDISQYVEAFIASPQDKVFVPYFDGIRGNPLLFPTKLVQQMKAKGRTIACRKFIDSNPLLTKVYQAPTCHFIADIDTPQDVRDYVLV